MKQWLRRFLGIDEINNELVSIDEQLMKLRNELAVTFFDETHPTRKALSDELGNRMIAKLKAEDMARKLTTGEL
jgi:hypothetical protein